MPLKKLINMISIAKSDYRLNLILISNDYELKKLLDKIALEIGASNKPSLLKNTLLLDLSPSEKLMLQFNSSLFAEGFAQSVTRNLKKIWHQEFEVHYDSNDSTVKIHLPSELFSRTQWFVYLFLDGLADKRIGRRWIK